MSEYDLFYTSVHLCFSTWFSKKKTKRPQGIQCIRTFKVVHKVNFIHCSAKPRNVNGNRRDTIWSCIVNNVPKQWPTRPLFFPRFAHFHTLLLKVMHLI